jgi:predicted permease
VVGRTVSLNGRPFTIVGVAPEGFNGPFALGAPDFWAPTMSWETFLTGAALENYNDRRALLTFMLGRLKPGVSIGQAQASLQVLGRNLEAEHPRENEGRNVGLMPLAQASIPPQVRGAFERAGGLLMVVVGLVLAIACANVANLLLGRALGRRREVAVRLSMGASRWRLIRQLLTESLLLSLLAGVVGLGLAFWGRNLLWSLRPPFLQNAPFDLALDPTVLGFTLAVSLVTGLVFGLAPALQATRPAVVDDLKQGTEGARRSFRVLSLRNALVVGQVTLCFVALIGSGLFLRSLGKAMQIDPGFDAERVGMMTFDVGAQGYDRPRGEQFFEELLERTRAVPGVAAAELAANVPLFAGGFARTVIVEGRDPEAENNKILTAIDPVGPDYFETMGVPILRGRAIAATDRADSPFVAVFNETAARRFWPEEEAVGKRFRFFGEDWLLEVVGIARDSKYNTIGEDRQAYIYLPRRQHYNQVMNLLVRTAGDPAQVAALVRNEARALDANLPITNVQPLTTVIQGSLWPARMGASLLGILGGLALALALIGIYGVMSYVVGQRKREIGIRMALGAEQGSVVGLFLRQGMVIVGVGLLVGIAAAAAFGRLIESLLYGLSGTDLTTFVLTALVFLGVAFFANLIPARRASGTDPLAALRTDR